MLRTRLWMGAVLIGLVVGVLAFDQPFAPWFPFLLVFVLFLAVLGTLELVWLIDGERRPPAWLALAIFVPKCCDIGAYFTGRLFGRHKMSPVLSPKKTWEGFAGGMVAALLVAFLLNRAVPALREDWMAFGFGATVGVLGVLGDL